MSISLDLDQARRYVEPGLDRRTSDGGNGNHSVLLPIILIKIKVDQMLLSRFWSLLYDFAFDFLFP